MEKNQQFYDPYNFNAIPQPNPTIDPIMDNVANPAMYYDQQFMYYRYLTQVTEYKIKLKELEMLNTKKES